MVAFKINKKATNLKSKKTDNGGIDNKARDARYDKIIAINFLYQILSNSKILNIIPLRIRKFFIRKIREILVNKKYKARKYFF